MNDHVNDHEATRVRPVTIKDVAEEAGVSCQTVSRAVNNKGEISAETRERVLGVVRELGYRPSSIARGLKTDRTLTIGLVVPDIANPFFAEVARGVSEVAHEAGYGVVLCNTDENAEREWAILRMLETHRVDGLVLVSSRLSDEKLEDATQRWRPVVLVNRLQTRSPAGVGFVLVNDADAAAKAVHHLVEREHRAIGFLGGFPESRSGLERRRGYTLAMHGAGLPTSPRWYVSCAPTVDGGRQAAQQLLADCPELTALLAYNDLVAVGAEQACRFLRRPIPESCALVGWDDIIFASYVSPPLTTLRMPKYQMGEKAMLLLSDLMLNDSSTPEIARLDAELVVREST